MTSQEQVEQAHLIGPEAVAGETGSSGSRLCPPCSTAPPSYWPGPAYLAALSRNHNLGRPPFKSKISAQSNSFSTVFADAVEDVPVMVHPPVRDAYAG